jgi:hypothetical protein
MSNKENMHEEMIRDMHAGVIDIEIPSTYSSINGKIE